MFQRVREFVDPSQWQRHTTSRRGLEVQTKWRDKKPYKYVPYALSFPAMVAESLIRDTEPDSPRQREEGPTLKTEGETHSVEMPKRTKKVKKKKLTKKKKTRKSTKKSKVRLSKRSISNPLPRRKPRKMRSAIRGTTMRAPVNQGLAYASGNTVSFAAGSRSGCLRIQGRQNLGNYAIVNTAGSYTYGMYLSATPATLTGQVFFNPGNTYYFTNPLSRLALIFQKFRVHSHRVEFITELATSYSGSMTWASVADPCEFQATFSGTYTGLATININQLQQFTTADTFPVYCTRRTLNLAPSDKWLYMSGPDYGSAYNVADDAADQRNFYAGAMAFVYENVSPLPTTNSTLVLFKAYYEYDIELCELSPLILGQVTLRRDHVSIYQSRRARMQEEIKSMLKEMKTLGLESKDESKVRLSKLHGDDEIEEDEVTVCSGEDVYGAAALATSVAERALFERERKVPVKKGSNK